MLNRGKLIHEDQRGISLIEMVTVLALIGLLAAAIVMTLAQVLNVSSSSSNRMIAVRQVQQAGKEVSKDVLQSQNVTCFADEGLLLTLVWEDWEGQRNNVEYDLLSMPSSPELRMLQRTHTIGEGPEAVEAVTVIAQYIDPDGTNCKPCCGLVPDKLVFTVTAQVGDHFETRTYEVKRRPTG